MDAEALLTEEPGTGEEEADFSMADLPRGDVTEVSVFTVLLPECLPEVAPRPT